MTNLSPTPKRFSTPTIALAIASLLALASVAFAVLRDASEAPGGVGSPAAKDWRVVGWAYAENGNPEASAAAYRRAAALEPDNPENWSSLGEALQTTSTAVVPEAAAAFAKAIKLDASDPRARYFLAVHKDLSGDHRGAVDDWLALLRDTPAGAPWEADLRRTIEQTAARHDVRIPGGLPAAQAAPAAIAAIPGPTADQLAAASSLPPAEQDKMVRGMVNRLAARLESNSRDADGWIRLMRSRTILKDGDGARAALRSGLSAFQDDTATQTRLRSAASQLGIADDR